jgi:hypothetical protein
MSTAIPRAELAAGCTRVDGSRARTGGVRAFHDGMLRRDAGENLGKLVVAVAATTSLSRRDQR